MHYENQLIIAEGDYVIAHGRFTGVTTSLGLVKRSGKNGVERLQNDRVFLAVTWGMCFRTWEGRSQLRPWFQRAVELEPGNPETVRMAAFSAEMLGRFDEALQLDRRAVELDPLNAASWEFRGETEFSIGQLDEAAADSKKALELNPDVWPGPILIKPNLCGAGASAERFG